MVRSLRALLAATYLAMAALGLTGPGYAESLGPDLTVNGGFGAAENELSGWVWSTADAEGTG